MNKRLLIVVFLMLLSMLSVFAGTVAAEADTVCILVHSDAQNDTPTGTLIVDVRFITEDYTLLFEQVYRIPAGTHNSIDAYVRAPAGVITGFENHTDYDPHGQSPLDYSVGAEQQIVDHSKCGGNGKIEDGRINATDLAAPLAAYCTPDNGIAIWDISDSGQGTLGFTATAAQISKALSDAASSGHNLLVGQGLGNSLYAITNGQLMLVGPEIKEPGKIYQSLIAGATCA